MDEYEFGSPKQKNQPNKPEKIAQRAIAGVTDPGSFDDLMDAYGLSLHRIAFRRGDGKPLGFEVRAVFPGVLKVTHVMDGQPVSKTCIEEGMYVLSIDGRRVRSEDEFKEIENSKRRVFRVALVKKRPAPFYTTSFPLPAGIERKHGHQYFLLRLDPTEGVRVGTGVGERGGAVVVTQVLEGSAGQYAGVIKGDRVLAVDDTPVDNRHTCKTLVQQSMGNPLDMIIERAPGVPAPPIPVRPPSPVAAAGSKPTSAPAPKPVRAPSPTSTPSQAPSPTSTPSQAPTPTPTPTPAPPQKPASPPSSPPPSPRPQPVDMNERAVSKPSSMAEVSVYLDPKARPHTSSPSASPSPPKSTEAYGYERPASKPSAMMDTSVYFDAKAKPQTSSPSTPPPSSPPPPSKAADTSKPNLADVSVYLDPKARPKATAPKTFDESIMLDKKR